ncbi:MAG: NAD(P)H nitroreductase [Peptococcaceae bacterium]|nr:NAD(P)H nitroreductase [Peptococcaceae bacterium]
MLDLLYQRRSIRKYQNKPIEEEKVQQLIKAALLAPSAKNINSQRFIVVKDKELLEKLSTARDHGCSFLKDAPLAIVVTADSSLIDVWIEDSAISAIILQLAAKSLGLGSCWAQIRERGHNDQKSAGQYVKEVLAIPENVEVECIIGIGYPLEEKPPKKDEDLAFERVFYNRFGLNK